MEPIMAVAEFFDWYDSLPFPAMVMVFFLLFLSIFIFIGLLLVILFYPEHLISVAIAACVTTLLFLAARSRRRS